MSGPSSPQLRLAQLVEYQKSELMRQQVMYMQAQQQQIKAAGEGGMPGPSLPFGASDGISQAATAAAAAIASGSAAGGVPLLGTGWSSLGALGGIDHMALLSMQQQSAAAAAAAAVGGMPVMTGLSNDPLSLHPPGTGPSQVSRTCARRLAQ